MRSENIVRLVPKDPDPFDETLALVDRLRWMPSENYSDDLVEWSVPGTDTVVRWVEDADTGVHFFVVEGPDRELVAEEIKTSIDMLQVKDFEGYLNGLSGDTQWLMRGLYAVAAAAPVRHDRRVVELLGRYMGSPDPLIRRVALLATGITAWPEFVEPVSRWRSDPDPDVREAAEAALQSLPAPH